METLQQQKTPQKANFGNRSSVNDAALSYPSRTIVHAKLEMTTSGDHDEQEADAAANDIVNGGKIRRKISGSSGSGTAVSPQVESQIAQLQGGGHAMPAGLRHMMENGFGRDFSQVRLHTGSQAADMSSSISARAFTHGNDIYFNRGQFSPNTSEGQRLVAHELTHVAQGTGKVGREEETNMSESPEAQVSEMSNSSIPKRQETSCKEFNPKDFYEHFKDVNIFLLLEASLTKIPGSAQRKALISYLKSNNLWGNELPIIYHQSSFIDRDTMANILIYLFENDVVGENKTILPSTVSNIIVMFDIGYEYAINTYINTLGSNNVIEDMRTFVGSKVPWISPNHIHEITLLLRNKINYRYENETFIANDGTIFRASDIPSLKNRIILDNLSKINHGFATTMIGGSYMIIKHLKGEKIDQQRFNSLLNFGNLIDDYFSNRNDVREMKATNSQIGAPINTGYSTLDKGKQSAIYGTNNPGTNKSTNTRNKLSPLSDTQLQKIGIQKYDYFGNLTITDR